MKTFKNILFILSTLIVVTSLSLAYYCYDAIKGLDEPNLEKIKEKSYSKIYDSSNNLVETLGENKKIYIEYENIPPLLINALISVEDNEFFYHDGVNYSRIIKSLFNNIFSSDVQGGSTITQQLVKNLILTNEQSLKRKIQEAYLALQLENKMTKEDILEFYFNEIYFEGTTPGIGYASKKFFSKDVSLLSLPECALLVGLVKSPSYYNPLKHIDRANERKNIVLKTMLDNNYITNEEYLLASKKHAKELMNVYINEIDQNYKYQAYLDIVYEEVESLTNLNPFEVPLEIETYLDTSIQTYLDQIQKGEVFSFSDENQQIASVILSNYNSSVIGVIGGRNYNGQMLYNRAYSSKRQPASTLKPIFTYLLAMEYLSFNEYTLVEDKPYTYKNTSITVQNADKKYLGNIPLVDALGYSRNTSTLYTLEKVINKIGQDKCVDYLKKINIMDEGTFTYPYAIGGMKYGVSPFFLAGSYALLPRNGNYLLPSTIKRIKRIDNGETIYIRNEQGEQIISEESCSIMTSTLEKVMDYNYYNINYARPSNMIIAGKTGTNAYDDNTIKKYNYPSYADKDVWFCGYSKDYTICSWTGFDQNIKDEKTYFGKNDGRRLIVKDIFKSSLEKLEQKNNHFIQSNNISKVNIVKNIPEYYLPNELIPSSYIVSASFKKGKEPTKILPLPEFTKINDVNIITTGDELQINISHELIDDTLYQPIFGERGYLITYEDENTLDNYFTTSNFHYLTKYDESFKITITETFKNNTKICGESYVFNYSSPHTDPIFDF